MMDSSYFQAPCLIKELEEGFLTDVVVMRMEEVEATACACWLMRSAIVEWMADAGWLAGVGPRLTVQSPMSLTKSF